MTHRGSRVLHVGSLSRVEGEGALHLSLRDGTVTDIWPIIPRGPGHHGIANPG